HSAAVAAVGGGYVGSLTLGGLDQSTDAVGWSYTVGDAQLDSLAAGQTLTQTYLVAVADGQGGSASQSISIVLTGTNDAPVITSAAQSGTAVEVADGAAGENSITHSASGTLNFADVDLIDTHSAAVAAVGGGYVGSLTLGGLDQSADAVGWSYTVGDAQLDSLAAGQTLTQTYLVTVADGHGGSATQGISIVLTGTNDAPVITSAAQSGTAVEVADGAAGENGITHSASGTLNFADVDLIDTHSAAVAAVGGGYVGSLTLGGLDQSTDAVGWSYTVGDAQLDSLAAGQTLTQTYLVTVADGQGGSASQSISIVLTGTNDAPTPLADAAYATEAGGVANATPGVDPVGNVLTNDTDVDAGDSKQVLAFGFGGVGAGAGATVAGAYGQLTLDTAGNYTYVVDNANATVQALRDAGDVLTETFYYVVQDAAAATATAQLVVAVHGANDAPVAYGNTISVAEEDAGVRLGQGLAGDLLPVPADVDSSALTITATGLPAIGVVRIGAGGPVVSAGTVLTSAQLSELVYDAPAELAASVTTAFTYAVSDGNLGTLGTVTINVVPVNDPPLAVDDTYAAVVGTTLAVAASAGVLVNDSDVDSLRSGWSVSLVSGPAATAGVLTLHADGGFEFAPAAGFVNSSASFVYELHDGNGGSAQATASIFVGPVPNIPPLAVNDAYTTAEDVALTVADALDGVLDNDSDDNGDPLTAVLLTQGAHGSVTLATDGSFVYRPGADFNGTDRFTYQARDGKGGQSAPATVSIVVTPQDDPPVARADGYSVSEDQVLTVAAAFGVLVNDIEPDGQPLTAVQIGNPSHGSVTLAANGSFVYTPNANFFGTDRFYYVANDGNSDSGLATVTITVNPVDDVPVALPDTFTVIEDAVLAASVTANDTPSGDGGNTWSVVTAPLHGAVSMGVDGTFVYTPGADYNGSDRFVYRIRDADGDLSQATVVVNVLPANDPPAAGDDAYAVNEDTRLTANVATNDSATDAPGTWSVVTGLGPSHGTLVSFNTATGQFVYQPNANYNGADQFAYRLTDADGESSTAVVDINVLPVNDLPLAANDYFTIDENTVLAGDVSLNDTPSGDDGPVYSFNRWFGVTPPPQHGTAILNADGTFTYVPAPDFSGNDAFVYSMRDVDGDIVTATVHIVVRPVNDAPLAVDDSYNVSVNEVLTVSTFGSGVLGNDSDPDSPSAGWTAQLVAGQGPQSGSVALAADGTFTYAPNNDFVGDDSFVYRLSDGEGKSATATAYLVVGGTANVPPAALNDAYTVAEDGVLTVAAYTAGVLGNDSDGDGDPLSANLAQGPRFGTLTLAGDGTFVYQPNTDFTGTDRFTYVARDGRGGQSSLATAVVVVAPVNDPPVAADDAYSGEQRAALTIGALAGVLANDSDLDGPGMSAVLEAGPSHGTVTLSANGSFVYTPTGSYYGPDSFTYRAFDGALYSDLATAAIDVIRVNAPPQAADDQASVTEETVRTIGVLVNDSDPDLVDGDFLTLLSETSARATLTPGRDAIVFDPREAYDYLPEGASASETFSYIVADSGALTSTANVTVTITGVNDAPRAGDDVVRTDEDVGTAVLGTLLANDIDPDLGDTKTIVGVDGTTRATIVDGGQTIRYVVGTPYQGLRFGQTVVETFSYTVADSLGLTDVATVTLAIEGRNDVPIAAPDGGTVGEDGVGITLDVLANDTDVDIGDVKLLVSENSLRASVSADGSRLIYTPGAAFQSLRQGETAVDTFSYVMRDGYNGYAVSTVAITVVGAHDAPGAADAPVLLRGGAGFIRLAVRRAGPDLAA
ncbi:MAG: Ig-like domain-containing protein, partial [Betaproteobacteria bacterium]